MTLSGSYNVIRALNVFIPCLPAGRFGEQFGRLTVTLLPAEFKISSEQALNVFIPCLPAGRFGEQFGRLTVTLLPAEDAGQAAMTLSGSYVC